MLYSPPAVVPPAAAAAAAAAMGNGSPQAQQPQSDGTPRHSRGTSEAAAPAAEVDTPMATVEGLGPAAAWLDNPALPQMPPVVPSLQQQAWLRQQQGLGAAWPGTPPVADTGDEGEAMEE